MYISKMRGGIVVAADECHRVVCGVPACLGMGFEVSDIPLSCSALSLAPSWKSEQNNNFRKCFDQQEKEVVLVGH